MKIVVHDTASAMLDLLHNPLEDREAALRDMLEPLQDAMSVIPNMDMVHMHKFGSGFPIDQDDTRYAPAVKELLDHGAWDKIENSLTMAWDRLSAAQPHAKTAETVHVVTVLGNPDDDLFAVSAHGYSGFGGIPGAIQLTIWPTQTSLAKIGYAAAHELHHNVRYANVVWDPMTVTVGEQVVAEGLAEAFVRELFGKQAMVPWATAASGTEWDETYKKVTDAIDVAGMQNLPPYVYGDTTAQRNGNEPAGLPDFAGYSVGLRIVDSHLAVSGLTAAESVALPAREILTNAGVATNA